MASLPASLYSYRVLLPCFSDLDSSLLFSLSLHQGPARKPEAYGAGSHDLHLLVASCNYINSYCDNVGAIFIKTAVDSLLYLAERISF